MKISKFISHNREISVGVLIVMILTLSVLVASNQSPKNVVEELEQPAKFVIASWDYPDEYGQGIEMFAFYENSTGSWVSAGDVYEYDQSYIIEWNESVAIKLRCYTFFNSTRIGAIDVEDGKNYQRHNVTVTDNVGTTVFSQQNFTYYSNVTILDPMWYYGYEVILNFLPLAGDIYTAAVTYELWTSDTNETILTATSGSTDAGTPTGDYTDTHSVNDVFFGGVDTTISVILWVEFATDQIGGFNYAAYWNATGVSAIHIYNHTGSDWVVLDAAPNGDDSPLSWDNDTVVNEDYFNTTTVGFKFYTTSGAPMRLFVDYFQIQTFSVIQWQVVSDVELIFDVPFHLWGYNTALIILGLVMIPVSTIYLAYGAKHDRSSDRLFYGLIILFLGFGLFIGGVLP